MKMLNRLQGLVGKKSSGDEDAPAAKPMVAEAAEKKKDSRLFVLRALQEVNKLEREGGTFVCASPDFECYFKKAYMPLFEEKNAYIHIAFDEADNVTHVCGLLPRVQHEKDRNKTEDEQITLAKMPDCLLSQAIAEVSRSASVEASRAGGVMFHGHMGSAQQHDSNFVFDPLSAENSLDDAEKEWLETMHVSLVDGEYKILMHLMQYLIVTRGFRETIENFLATRQELQPGSRSKVIESFRYLARAFQVDEQTITVARIGSSLEQALNLTPKATFSVIVELFFCLGYDKEIKGYTTGFIEAV